MTRDERELLARMMTANQNMGEVVRLMLERLADGGLDPTDLRNVGRQLALLGADMVRHADRLDRGGSQVIPAQPPLAVPRGAFDDTWSSLVGEH